MSDKLIANSCVLDGVVKLLGPQKWLRLPQRREDQPRNQEVSDIESEDYPNGTISIDHQRLLSGTESLYEAYPNFHFIPALPLGLLQTCPQSSSPFLTGIPTELHLLIFSHLDLIDSTCLGLTNTYFYNLQKALNDTVTLHTRRKGCAWELQGKQVCRHCGVHKCHLHMHLREWMPTTHEYCAIRQVYCLRATEGSKTFCYRNNPLKPEMCGRHPVSGVKG